MVHNLPSPHPLIATSSRSPPQVRALERFTAIGEAFSAATSLGLRTALRLKGKPTSRDLA